MKPHPRRPKALPYEPGHLGVIETPCPARHRVVTRLGVRPCPVCGATV